MATPEQSQLTVHVKSVYPAFSRWLEIAEVEVEDGVLELNIELENHAVDGVVLDPEGEPLRRARVVVMGEDGKAAEALSEVDGRFTVEGLESGPHKVWATLRNYGSSQARTIQIADGREIKDVRLTVSPGEVRSGRLLTAEGVPVGGARLRLSVPGQPGWLTSTSSDADGGFEINSPPGSQRVVATVTAPSIGMLWSTCVELSGDQIDLFLPASTGAVVIDTAGGSSPSEYVLVTSDGGALSKGELLRWTTRHGGTVTPSESRIPGVGNGFYALLRDTSGSGEVGCHRGALAPIGVSWPPVGSSSFGTALPRSAGSSRGPRSRRGPGLIAAAYSTRIVTVTRRDGVPLPELRA
ncbi:MAG: carboxypeptidase-like regulatory domain-containing protein [Acidobacteriota bacterium]